MDERPYCGRCRSFCARNAPCPCCHARGFARPHTLARDAIDAYEQRVPGARQARTQDPTANYGWQLTTHLLDVANAAMADEGVEPAARYRVIQAILYGGPNPADAWQREQMTAEMAKTLAALPPQMTVTPERFEEMRQEAVRDG